MENEIFEWRTYVVRLGKVQKVQIGRPVPHSDLIEYCTGLISSEMGEHIKNELNRKGIKDTKMAHRLVARLVLKEE